MRRSDAAVTRAKDAADEGRRAGVGTAAA